MANRKKEVYKPKPMTEGKRNVIQGLLREYDIQTAEDIQDALKDLLVFCQALFPKKSVRIPCFHQGIFPAFGG